MITLEIRDFLEIRSFSSLRKKIQTLIMDLLIEVSPDYMKKHEPPPVKYLHLNDRVIAYRYLEGKGPTLIYVGGFLSSMEIHKATAIEQYAKNHGRASIRYDQASVGLSSGIDRKDAYNSVWVQDCLAMMDLVIGKRPVILIASSNGAQISAHIAKIRPDEVKGLILIGNSEIFLQSCDIFTKNLF